MNTKFFLAGRLPAVIGISLLSMIILLIAQQFLWTGSLHTTALRNSLNDQPGYITAARNLYEHGRLESSVYYPAQILHYKDHNIHYMPGSYYVRAAFYYLFGYSLFVSVLPNIISFIGSAILIFLIAESLFGRKVAYCTSILFMTFPPIVLYSFTAMMELLFMFAVLLAFYAMLKLPQKIRYGVAPLLFMPAVLIRKQQFLCCVVLLS